MINLPFRLRALRRQHGVSQLIGEAQLDQEESVCVVRCNECLPLSCVADQSLYRYESMAANGVDQDSAQSIGFGGKQQESNLPGNV